MLILKSNPRGIDTSIQRLQTELHNQLMCVWQMGEDDYKCFGRAYANQAQNGIVPEAYTGGIEYREVMLDDTLTAISFFVTTPRTILTPGEDAKTNVGLVFHVNLEKLKKYLPHRADEEAHTDVYRILQDSSFTFQTVDLVTGIASVYAEFAGIRRDEGLKYGDLHPYHCFRFNLTINYNPNC